MTTNEIKKGMVLELDGNLMQILDFQHVLQNKVSYVRVKMRNVRTGATNQTTLNTGVKINVVTINHQDMQYLYHDGDFYSFMNMDDYTTVEVPAERLEWEKQFMVEGMMVKISLYGDEIIGVQLPDKVELEVTETTDAVAGNTSTTALKDATVETGLVVQVPMFIKNNEKILVSTEDGTYKGRA